MATFTLDLRNAAAYLTAWSGSIVDPDSRMTSSAVTTGGMNFVYAGTSSLSGGPPVGGFGISLTSRALGSASGVVNLTLLPADAVITQVRVTARRDPGEAHATWLWTYVTGPTPPVGAYNVSCTTIARVKVIAAPADIADDIVDTDTNSAAGQFPGATLFCRSDTVVGTVVTTKTTALASITKAALIGSTLDFLDAVIGDAGADAHCAIGANGGAAFDRLIQVDQTISGFVSFTYLTYEVTYTSVSVAYTLSPTSGPEVGGTPVSITGASGLTGASAVFFGAVPATSVVAVNDGLVTAVSPAGTGTVAVTVVVGAATFSVTPSFTYISSPVITTTSVPDGSIGVPYSQSVVAIGGTPPYVFSLVGGALPPFLAIAPSGLISGTPAGPAGVSSFTVRVTDALLNFDDQALTITIANPVVITTTVLPTATSGTAYSALVEAAFGVPPYVFTLTAGALPATLSLATSGAVTGMPAAIGHISPTSLPDAAYALPYSQQLSVVATEAFYPITVRVTDSIGGIDEQGFNVALTGIGPYTYSLVSGALPTNLTLSSAGLISGTPPAAPTPAVMSPPTLPPATVDTAYSVPLTVTGTSVPFAFTVRATIGAVSVPDQAYTVSLTSWAGWGGAPPPPTPGGTVTWTVVITGPPSTPPGFPSCVSLGALTGIVSGTPVQVRTVTVTVRATDSLGNVVTTVYTYTVTST